MLISNTLATKENQVKQGEYFAENPQIVKIFDDLEQFKLFCQTAFGWGHDGYVFNEKDLYNNRSRAWRLFKILRKVRNVLIVEITADVTTVIGETSGDLYCRY